MQGDRNGLEGNLMGNEHPPAEKTTSESRCGTPDDTLMLQQTQMTPAAEGGRADTSASAAPPVPEHRYVFARRLGEGGMAIVYDAHDCLLDRPIAVKMLKKEFLDNLDTTQRFFQEVHLLAQMDHPGIIAVHDQGAEPGQGPFYTMKRVQGKNLRELLRSYPEPDRKKREVMASLLDVFERVCDTVAYAHSQGIIHRDLKPENIMVDEYGVVLVMDWGLAKKVGAMEQAPSPMHTQAGAILGTPYYMSPEQASGKVNEIDCRSDVFALGVVLYEILTGQLPFYGSTFEDVLEQLQKNEPVPPRKRNRNVPRVLADICMKALSKDPGQRYSSARELAKDLHLYEASLPTSAHRPSLPERIGNAALRHPVRATIVLTLGVVLLLTAGVLGSILASHEASRSAQVELAGRFDRSMRSAITELDNEIGEIQSQLNDGKELSEDARHKLETKLSELLTVRDSHLYQIDMVLMTVLPILLREDVADAGGSELLTSWRQARLGEFQRLISEGELYRVHFSVWMALVNPRLAGWTPDDLDVLLRLKSDVEAKLAAKEGPDFVPPNWEQYTPPMTFADYLSESIVEQYF